MDDNQNEDTDKNKKGLDVHGIADFVLKACLVVMIIFSVRQFIKHEPIGLPLYIVTGITLLSLLITYLTKNKNKKE